MQKSKSSSNVGQFVTRKILKSRSKSQTRSPTQTTPNLASKWAPSDKFTWTSESGDRIVLLDASLQTLSDIEAQILQKVALEKISELNIGINIAGFENKTEKRRILPKKKAMTTSFFDIGRKDEQYSSNLFGNSLEGCLANDQKRRTCLVDRASRNSIASLFRGSTGGDKLSESVRSCESLPSESVGNGKSDATQGSEKFGSGYFGNLTKSSIMQISRSQSDVRRKSQEFDQSFNIKSALTSTSSNASSTHTTQAINDYATMQVPSFVSLCIKFLEDNGLHQVGLFRVSTSKKRVKQLREDFDKNSTLPIRDGTSPHDIATLLKEFLRDLPEPLLCSGLHKPFLETQKIRNRRLQLEAMSHLVKLLPAPHRDTLYVLLRFLAKVASCSDDVNSCDENVKVSGNKMDSNNLATVFAPNILRTQLTQAGDGISNSEQETMNDAINVIRIMIDHYEELFKVSAELLDVVYSHMLDICPEKLYILCEQRSILGKDETAFIGIGSSTDNLKNSVSIANEAMTTGVKKLYTRKSVMHENDASKAPDIIFNGTKNSKRHSDPYKSRNSHSSIYNNDSRYENRKRSDNNKEIGTERISEMRQKQHASPSIVNNKSGVVSASLQIPVQSHLITSNVETRTSVVSGEEDSSKALRYYDQSDLDDVFYKNDYSDIPYIEDVSGQDLENSIEGFSISGALSLSAKMDRTSLKDKQKNKQQLQQSRSQIIGKDFINKNHKLENLKRLDLSSADSTNKKITTSSLEPKLPTSISNIGGAILRSKTADFERMSLQKHQQTKQSLAGSVSGNKLTGSHLYKRQELIQSAKANSTNNK